MPEAGESLFDEAIGLQGVGEVGGNEEDVICGLDGVALEENRTGGGEFVRISSGQDELRPGAAVAFGEGEAETAGAAGDEDDLAVA